MALRDYVCNKCGKTTEVLERKDEAPQCGHCESNDVLPVKGIAKTSFALKGGGWFKDGYSKAGR